MQAKCDGIDALGEAADIFRKRKVSPGAPHYTIESTAHPSPSVDPYDQEFIRELAAAVPTDSMGPCLHNMEPRYPFNDFGGALGRRLL